MVDYDFWYNEISASSMGVVLQDNIQISGASPRVDSITVPGRNGDVHIFDGSFENRSASVDCFALKKEGLAQKISQINNWLLGSFGYKKLVTKDDKDHYLMAIVNNGADINSRLGMLAPFSISFDCKPQRFLRSGDEIIIIEENQSLINPTMFPAAPVYKIYGNGEGEFSVGNNTMHFLNISEYLYYDSETDNAWKDDVSWNNAIVANNVLKFDPGSQDLIISGGITRVEIMPRWWEI